MKKQKHVAFTNPFKARIKKFKDGWIAYAPYGYVVTGMGKGCTGVLLGCCLESREDALALVEEFYKKAVRHV